MLIVVGRGEPSGGNPQALVVGDFNGHGILDVAVTSFGSNRLAILIGVGWLLNLEGPSPSAPPWPRAAGNDPPIFHRPCAA